MPNHGTWKDHVGSMIPYALFASEMSPQIIKNLVKFCEANFCDVTPSPSAIHLMEDHISLCWYGKTYPRGSKKMEPLNIWVRVYESNISFEFSESYRLGRLDINKDNFRLSGQAFSLLHTILRVSPSSMSFDEAIMCLPDLEYAPAIPSAHIMSAPA